MNRTTKSFPPLHITQSNELWVGMTKKRSEPCIASIYTLTQFQLHNNIFKLEHVHDMSYKPFSSGAGFFYLHTTQGVFTYEVDTDPTNFIRTYKNLR